MNLSRRHFMGGCAALGLSAGAQFSWLPKAHAGTSSAQHTLIYVFLRGGLDGLNLVCPTSGVARTNYENYRPTIAVPKVGETDGALALADGWGLNPRASGFHDLWQQGKLAIVHATGMPAGFSTRSHFDAQRFIEHGSVAQLPSMPVDGWMARYLEGTTSVTGAFLPAVSTTGSPVASLAGFPQTASIGSIDNFHAVGEKGLRDDYLALLQGIHAGQNGLLPQAVLNAKGLIQKLGEVSDELTPHADYPKYDNGRLRRTSQNFHDITRFMKNGPVNFGLHAVAVNIGGWDTHRSQGADGGGGYGNRVAEFTGAIAAFFKEAATHGFANQFTIIVQSEFGRRVKENADRGTDHGTGNPMFVLGNNIRGGKFYGTAPTLNSNELFQREDVPVTTDYRQVLAEVLANGLGIGERRLGEVFPNYTQPAELNLVRNKVVEVLFASGFE